MSARERAHARWETERLFARLQKKNQQEEGVVEVKYAERGPSVFWITAPIGHRNLAWVTRVANVAHQKCHYSPTIVNGRQKICLCLKYRFRDHNESDRLEIAKKLAWWAERIFEMPAIISSFSGFVEARKRLGLS